ncbi:unnamed protein product [Amoebophrya sp. A120]|nr:unnamed protein product [Amoebophrya sp. A120]|eukprot:GSA120T00019773001.1
MPSLVPPTASASSNKIAVLTTAAASTSVDVVAPDITSCGAGAPSTITSNDAATPRIKQDEHHDRQENPIKRKASAEIGKGNFTATENRSRNKKSATTVATNHEMSKKKNPWSNEDNTGVSRTYFQHFYHDILETQNVEKFHDYFTEDCEISINGIQYDAKGFTSRMEWLRENTEWIKVKVLNSSVSNCGLKISDAHESVGMKKVKRASQELPDRTSESCESSSRISSFVRAMVLQISDLCPRTFRIRKFFDATYHPQDHVSAARSGVVVEGGAVNAETGVDDVVTERMETSAHARTGEPRSASSVQTEQHSVSASDSCVCDKDHLVPAVERGQEEALARKTSFSLPGC